jgi:hypothetical protein
VGAQSLQTALLQPLQRVPLKARPPTRLVSRCFSSLLSVCVQPQASCGAAAMVRGEKRAWVRGHFPTAAAPATRAHNSGAWRSPAQIRAAPASSGFPPLSLPTKPCVAKGPFQPEAAAREREMDANFTTAAGGGAAAALAPSGGIAARAQAFARGAGPPPRLQLGRPASVPMPLLSSS